MSNTCPLHSLQDTSYLMECPTIRPSTHRWFIANRKGIPFHIKITTKHRGQGEGSKKQIQQNKQPICNNQTLNLVPARYYIQDLDHWRDSIPSQTYPNNSRLQYQWFPRISYTFPHYTRSPACSPHWHTTRPGPLPLWRPGPSLYAPRSDSPQQGACSTASPALVRRQRIPGAGRPCRGPWCSKCSRCRRGRCRLRQARSEAGGWGFGGDVGPSRGGGSRGRAGWCRWSEGLRGCCRLRWRYRCRSCSPSPRNQWRWASSPS